jgi:hypothetical protein
VTALGELVPELATLQRPAEAQDPLDVVAGKIRALLQKSEDQRLTAARLLAEARGRVDAGEAGEIGWQAWCKEHVQRSQRDVRRLLTLAAAPDPAEALEAERKATREQVSRQREKADIVCPVPILAAPAPIKEPEPDRPAAPIEEPALAPLIAAWDGASEAERAAFLAYVGATPELCYKTRQVAVSATPAEGYITHKDVGIVTLAAAAPVEPLARTEEPPRPDLALRRQPVALRRRHPGMIAAVPVVESAVAIGGDDALMAAFKSSADWPATRKWAMCGYALGHAPPDGTSSAFVQAYREAPENNRRALRVQIADLAEQAA